MVGLMVEVVGFMVEVWMGGEGLIDLALFPSAKCSNMFEIILLKKMPLFRQEVVSNMTRLNVIFA